jgi:hypothetical protein
MFSKQAIAFLGVLLAGCEATQEAPSTLSSNLDQARWQWGHERRTGAIACVRTARDANNRELIVESAPDPFTPCREADPPALEWNERIEVYPPKRQVLSRTVICLERLRDGRILGEPPLDACRATLGSTKMWVSDDGRAACYEATPAGQPLGPELPAQECPAPTEAERSPEPS